VLHNPELAHVQNLRKLKKLTIRMMQYFKICDL
jgi:hypothetical protein